MLKNHLQHYLEINRMYNSWIIEAHDLQVALEELKDFVAVNLLPGSVPLLSHPDFKLIEKPKSGVGSKNISIEQIRSLQQFLNKTSGVSDNKVAIIFQADLMNLNAANSCLKILEDTSKNTYIFLLTSNSSLIIPTIKSRCLEIKLSNENQHPGGNNYEKYLALLINNNVDQRLGFLKELSNNNKEIWVDFAQSNLDFLSKSIKKSAGFAIDLTDGERRVFKQFKLQSVSHLMKKFESLNKLLEQTTRYDLDLKASFIIIINLFKS